MMVSKLNEIEKTEIDDLLLKIKELQEQMRSLEAHLSAKSSAVSDTIGVQFLLSEYNALGELWKQTDATAVISRIGSS